MNPRPLHGVLLTGGASSRMGADKAVQTIGGIAISQLVADALKAVAHPVVVVGPHADLAPHTILDDRRGPLAAFVTGWTGLQDGGFNGAVLLAAGDLPFVTSELFGFLAGRLMHSEACLPLLDGRAQPLAACYAPAALVVARRLLAAGEDSMRALTQALRVDEVAQPDWEAVAPARALFDVDTPEELERARRWAGAPGRRVP